MNHLLRTRDELWKLVTDSDAWKRVVASEPYIAWQAVDDAVRRVEDKLGTTSDGLPTRMRFTLTEAQVEQLHKTPDALETAVAVISEKRRPCPTDELVAAIEARGVRLAGKDPLKVFRSRLSKDKRLQSIQVGPSQKLDRAWWLVDQPVPSEPGPDLSRGFEPQKISAPAGSDPAEAVKGSGGG